MPNPNVLWRAIFWSVLFLLLALAPLGIAIFGERPEPRGFWVELGVALGFVAYAILALQFATTSRFRWVMPLFGTDTEVRFHRIAGMLAVGFALLHPVVLISADSDYWSFFDPAENLPRAVSLVAVIVALALLIVLSLWRLKFRLKYEWWRLSHGLLAVLVILIGFAHGWQVEHYIAGLEKRAAWIVVGIVPLGLWAVTRGIKPYRSARQPWRVTNVQAECPEVYRIVLEPEDSASSNGTSGLRFEAGQYAWLTIDDSPWTLQQHPFSLLSSADSPQRIEFGIKELGDFTSAVGDISPGTRAFLEGPYGSFKLEPDADGAIFIVGGIGITPVMSILRTCRDRGDRRPFLLIYANPNWEEIAFREELESLANDLNLNIVHVLEKPPDGWQGESGFVTKEMIDRHRQQVSLNNPRYFTCGPDPMMDVVQHAVMELKVPQHQFVSERFGWV